MSVRAAEMKRKEKKNTHTHVQRLKEESGVREGFLSGGFSGGIKRCQCSLTSHQTHFNPLKVLCHLCSVCVSNFQTCGKFNKP